MKQIYKNYIFSNFEFDNKSNFQKNQLKIKDAFNLKLENGKVISANSFNSYFYEKLNNSNKFDIFFNENGEKLQKMISCISYEYNDEINQILANRYFLLDIDFKLYEINFNTLTITYLQIKFNEFPLVVKENGLLYLYDKNDVYLLEGGGDFVFLSDVIAPYIYEKVDAYLFFVPDKEMTTIYISEDTNLLNLSNDFEVYDKIVLDEKFGNILDIIAVGSELFIFQQYKVSSYDLYSSKKNLINECALNSEIIENTIFRLNDYVLFVTSSGLKKFNGNSIDTKFDDIFQKIIKEKSSDIFASVYNDKYYLKSGVIYNEKYQCVLFEFDLDNNSYVCYSIDNELVGYFIITNKDEYSLVFVFKDDENYSFKVLSETQKGMAQILKFKPVYFDEGENKQIDKISFMAKGSFLFKINSDMETCELISNGNTSFQNISIKGNVFNIEIYSDDEFELDAIFIRLLVGD